MKKDNSNLRVILAVAFSFLFIVLYSNYFVKPDEKQASQAPKEASAQAANQAPQIKQESQSAPQLESSQEAKSILATIKAKDFEIEIDTLGRISQVYLKDKKFTTAP